MGPRDFNGMYRDNEEEFHLADGTTLRRLEKGEPSKATMYQHNLNVNYSLQASENSLFSATLRLRGNNQPHWDYKGTLYNANDEADVVDMTDRTDQSWTRPSLDLYYQQDLKNKQNPGIQCSRHLQSGKIAAALPRKHPGKHIDRY